MRQNCCASCVNPGYKEVFVQDHDSPPLSFCCCCPHIINNAIPTGDWKIDFDEVAIQVY